MKLNKYYLILLIIFLLGFVLRFYKATVLPPINADEAALGYNAYSLIQTGKDEHGNSWPINFQSFNDYKPGGYVYMILPFVYLFGLNALSIRFISVFLGSVSIFLIALFIKNWFGNMQHQKKEYFSLSAALMLAISPWHIHFSRGGWEVNAATFFMLLGVYWFTKAIKKPRFYFLSIIALVISLYIYHASRVVAPLLGLGLLIFNRSYVKRNVKLFSVSFVFGIVLALPLIFSVVTGGALSRASGVGITADLGIINRINELRGQHENTTGVSAKAFHNKPLYYSIKFFSNWGEHYKGEFLFISGDEIQRNKVPETGLLYLVEILFILVAGWVITKQFKSWGFIYWWLLVAPLAAAFTFQSPHALRAQNMTIPLAIFSGFGLSQILVFAKKQKSNIKPILYLLVFFALGLSVARYLIMYYKHMPKEYPYSSQYGFSEMADYVTQEEHKFEKIFITTRYDQPYILMLYYTKYPSSLFQADHKLTKADEFGFSTVDSYAKFNFTKINFYELARQNPDSLIIGTDEEIPDESNVVHEIYFPSGEVAFQVVAN